MANITAALVKELRERTGVAMMECKKALVAADGDIEKAIEEMRKSGMAKAAKKAGRTAAEGAIIIADGDNKAVILEVNSETDFVARDENFINFCQQVVNVAIANEINDVETLLAANTDGVTVEEARQTLISKIGENINVRRIVLVKSSDNIGSYRHGDKIGVVVVLSGGDAELARDIAMHIAATKPEVINPEDVSEESINHEKEIFSAQALESGKPVDIVEKMVAGRIKKFLNEISLTGQPFVKNPEQTVGALLKEKSAKVENFVRFEVGEGIEKEADNFVEEVMAQARNA
jgi:elongation factor Ts